MTIPNYRDQIKVVFFDIDDTLFMKQRDFLPATVPVFMRKLKENGIIPAIATGRTRCAFPHKLNRVIEQEGIDLFVTMNGQMASYRGQVIEKHVIPTEKIRHLVHFFEQHNMPFAFVSDHTVAVSERNSVVQFAMDPILKDYIVDKAFFEGNDIGQVLPFIAQIVMNLCKIQAYWMVCAWCVGMKTPWIYLMRKAQKPVVFKPW